MAHDDALYRNICDHPDDDAPRLIYADWLEEHGDRARAEFIRVQLELAQIKYPYRNPNRWNGLAGRQNSLLLEHKRQWLGPLAELPFKWEFQRGFPATIIVDDLAWLRTHADAALALAPVCRVWFRDTPEIQHYLDDHNWFVEPRIDDLDLSCITRFQEIDASNHHMGDDVLTLIVQALGGNIRWLSLANTAITQAGAAAISAAPQLANLRELNISGNKIGTGGARQLLESPHLKSLQELHAHHIGIDYRSKTARELRERFGEGLHW